MALARSNIYAVSAELSKSEYAAYFASKYGEGKGQNLIPELFFMVRAHAPTQLKILLQNITKNIILKKSLNISGRGLRGSKRIRINYYPGVSEFDLEQTIFNFIQRGRLLSYSDIMAIERQQIKKNVVLILDTSGSMFGALLMNAALATSVLSYAMAKDTTAVVLFSQEAYLLKGIRDNRAISILIDQILESEAVGFTNISVGLTKGLEEIKKIKARSKKNTFGILISDGDYNRGHHPAVVAREFPKLHVIGIPNESKKDSSERGLNICREIAKAGRGFFYPVKHLSEIPHTLMKLIQRI